jgi:hypothetical protein
MTVDSGVQDFAPDALPGRPVVSHVNQREAAAATRSAASSRGGGRSARPGSEVSTTQMVSLAGSAQR